MITDEKTNHADQSDHEIPELAEVLLLPAAPLPPLVHIAKLVEVALMLIETGRVEIAKGPLRAILKVTARAGEVPASPGHLMQVKSTSAQEKG